MKSFFWYGILNFQKLPIGPSKYKEVVTTFSQSWANGCIDVVNSSEMTVSPTS